ncbi:hypothetical protein GVN24_33620 [Rhizobium sp. CRIBSB]|nr:hypothetical protein [Rhizobium sp. CRIBSB]
MKNVLKIASVFALAAAVSGCASLVTGGDLIRPGEPTGVIRVQNGGSGVINAVLISDCNASTYGLNRLPSGYSITPGQSYDFQVSSGCWDAMAGRIGYGDVSRRMQIPANGIQIWTVSDN